MAALDAACAAQNAWAATPPRDRADILARTYQGIIDRRDDFTRLIVDEMGKPWAEAQTKVDYGAGFFRWFAESAFDTVPTAFTWGNNAWRGLRALMAYAEDRANGWDKGGFWEWCASGPCSAGRPLARSSR
ncbi:aldehyde dehydrogenase family protein [Arthrobacter sp. ISL-5]|uniref:aldehyde dehydrogenase family protein n=1 Tax=Arthrobacter sp. ISL-5 TaxID=2819111 RepID=UPI002035CF3A|nr:aldehyde dehydrogenase family protein [Arthrobacter sp. ISL-5]